MNDKKGSSSWAVLGVLALPVLCCGLPALIAAGILAGVGGWLAAYGFWLGGVVALLAAVVIFGRRVRRRDQCDIPESHADQLSR